MHDHKHFRKQCLKEDSVHLLRTHSPRLRDHGKGEGGQKDFKSQRSERIRMTQCLWDMAPGLLEF